MVLHPCFKHPSDFYRLERRSALLTCRTCSRLTRPRFTASVQQLEQANSQRQTGTEITKGHVIA